MITTSAQASFPAPHIMRADYRTLSSDDAQRVIQIENEFNHHVQAHQRDFRRMYEVWRLYFGAEGGQWPESDLSLLKEESRHAYQFDITSPKVDTMAGALVADMPEPDWVPVQGQHTSGVEAQRESYYSDKEVCNYNNVLMDVCRDGLVHVGWLRMTETRKHNPLGNIGIERILPGFFVPSSYWKTNNDRDLKEGYLVGYYTAEGIAHKFKAKHDDIMREIERVRRHGQVGAGINAPEQRQRFAGMIGDEFRVIEYHWLEMVDTTRLVGYKTDTAQLIPFPVTKDREYLQAFADANDIDWETVREVPYDDTIHHQTTICPDLSRSLVLSDKKSRIQVRGLPFFHFTVSRYNGQNKGIAESIMDLQRTINRRESTVTELIEKAHGGAELWDENLFDSPADKQKWLKRRNRPGYAQFADLSQVKREAYIKARPSDYPAQLVDQIGRMYDIVGLISRVSDTLSAQTNSEDNAALFERKYQVSRIGNMLLEKNLRQLVNNIGEAYHYQWPITYAKIPRTITARDGKRSIEINKKTILPDGRIAVQNAVEYTPRCRVIITENQQSITYKMRYQGLYADVLKILPEDSLYRPMYLAKWLSTIDHNDKDNAELEVAKSLELSKAQMAIITQMTDLHAKMKNNALYSAQADAQLRELNMQYQQMSAMQRGNSAPVQQLTYEDEQVRQPDYSSMSNSMQSQQYDIEDGLAEELPEGGM